ncbi:DUF4145 domain-containing protein [Chrysosporum bergii ANA360D]|uniref:DUF4145 domain-containing protein n=1 Tax=Chrysosporum bergii ANA360D TaxID=617107 RepID=A0AA43KBW3_9CYAN|nr:DUF4145 domain-containing protein [Chrysosporum bergii]MDH6060852.1 DUF4145 domain-containing protein [Chrysosporum bergii ANA360D]
MTLPTNLLNKYLSRFEELITEGEEIDRISLNTNPQGLGCYTNNYQPFMALQAKCITLFSKILPPNHPNWNLIEELRQSDEGNKVDWIYRAKLNRAIGYLKAIKSDFEQGFLGDLAIEIESEIAADYMGQAEQLLAEGTSGKYDHVPAAVLSGAVLEKALKTLCDKQTPPIATINAKGSPLTLNPLIDDLKKAGVFNELTAKQLRAWADIRNQAAHGEFEQFTRSDVELMIKGIGSFLANYMA